MPTPSKNDTDKSFFLNPKFISTLLQIIGVISIPSTVLGIAAAFLGWRSSSAYLLTFGIGLGWTTEDILSLIVNAWVEIGLILLMISLFIVSRIVVNRLMEAMRPARRITTFLCVLLILIGLLIYILLRYFAITEGMSLRSVFILEGGGLLIWWVFIVVTDVIIHTPSDQFKGSFKRVQSILTLVFSSRAVIGIMTVALFAYFMLDFAVMHGTHFALRDISQDSHLPLLTINANSSLDIPLERVNKKNDKVIYNYDDLRLILKTEEYLFAFRISEVDPENIASRVYVVPLRNIDSLTIRKWDWISSNPAPIPTPSTSP